MRTPEEIAADPLFYMERKLYSGGDNYFVADVKANPEAYLRELDKAFDYGAFSSARIEHPFFAYMRYILNNDRYEENGYS